MCAPGFWSPSKTWVSFIAISDILVVLSTSLINSQMREKPMKHFVSSSLFIVTSVFGAGQMARLPFIIAVITLSSIGPNALAGIVFDNFGAGDSYITGAGNGISGATSFLGRELDTANAFTPSGSGFVSNIWLAAGLNRVFPGTNELEVWLMDDNNNEPGNILEAFLFVDAMGFFGDSNPLLNAEASGETFLMAGEQYWLAASAPVPDTYAAWNYNIIGFSGPIAFREDMGNWNVISNTVGFGAFRISVPEPTTVVLLGLGLAGLGFARRWLH